MVARSDGHWRRSVYECGKRGAPRGGTRAEEGIRARELRHTESGWQTRGHDMLDYCAWKTTFQQSLGEKCTISATPGGGGGFRRYYSDQSKRRRAVNLRKSVPDDVCHHGRQFELLV